MQNQQKSNQLPADSDPTALKVSLLTQAEPQTPTNLPTLIFALMTLTNILINLDHGILPACTKEMSQHFGMDKAQLGLLGSIVYLGIVLVGTLAGQLYLRFNSKFLTVIALILLQGTLGLFVLSDHKWTAYVSRFLIGAFQVFLLVYYPVWIDKFGQQKKTLWLTILQICVPIGIFAGYGLTATLLHYNLHYQLSFYIQIVLVAFFILGFTFIPSKKLDCRREQYLLSQSFIDSVPIIRQNLINSELVGPHPIQDIAQQQHKKRKRKYKYTTILKKLIKSKMYLVGTFTMATILFVSTGIQFWLTDYFIYVLHFPQHTVNIAYAIISITGPTLGCAFGGFIISKRGGYEHPTTVYVVFIFSSIGIGCAVIIPFLDGFYPISFLLWVLLFFGGAMMPGLTGIMMVSIPPYLRAFGNSNGQIIKNIIGYLPAPFLYGLFQTMLGQRAGLKLIMFWGLWAPFLLLLGSIHRYRQIQRLKKIQEQQDGGDLKSPTLKTQYSIPTQPSEDSPRKQRQPQQSIIPTSQNFSQYKQQSQPKYIQPSPQMPNNNNNNNNDNHHQNQQTNHKQILINGNKQSNQNQN